MPRSAPISRETPLRPKGLELHAAEAAAFHALASLCVGCGGSNPYGIGFDGRVGGHYICPRQTAGDSEVPECAAPALGTEFYRERRGSEEERIARAQAIPEAIQAARAAAEGAGAGKSDGADGAD